MSTPGTRPPAFWDYSVALYGRVGVEAACLSLQNRRGADVNILLLCCWAGAAGHVFKEAELDRLIAAVAPWRAGVIEPLRAVRRVLKHPPGAAPGEPVAVLHDRVLEDEIAAEAIEQTMLAGRLAERVCCAALPSPEAAMATAANLACYLSRLDGAANEADLADAARLIDMACEGLAPGEAPDRLRAALSLCGRG